MAESSLTLTRLQLKEALGEQLSISRDPNDWSADAAADVNRILAKGLRSFYLPMIRSKNPNAPLETYLWNFLIRRTTVSLSNGTNLYSLGDDFSGWVDTELAFTTSKDWSLKLVEMWRVLEKVQVSFKNPPSSATTTLSGVRGTISTLY